MAKIEFTLEATVDGKTVFLASCEKFADLDNMAVAAELAVEGASEDVGE